MKPVIIIGAARSGTNMLRDTICKLEDFATWDCDEINPIWRHGNLNHPNDRFTAEMVNPKISKFIRRAFESIGNKYKVNHVVEKSCANSLRVEFIDQIFPDAKYLFIYRDGRDTVASSKIRWKSKFELGYTLKKMRYVPVTDLPFYAMRFGLNRIKKILNRSESLGFWGVHVPGLLKMVKEKSLEEVCAFQWKGCIDQSLSDLATIDENRICRIQYETFVQDSINELGRVCEFLGVNVTEDDLKTLTKNISSKSIGKFRKEMSSDQILKVEALMKGTLIKLDYK